MQLSKAGAAAPSIPRESAGRDKPVGEPSAYPADTLPIANPAIAAPPIPTLLSRSEPHYFRPSELTQKPVVSLDDPSDMKLLVPGLPPRPAILRLLINDEGEVDRVVVEDSYIPEPTEHLIIDAFLKIKFHPGKIGRIPVRSQLRVEVMLESMPPLTK